MPSSAKRPPRTRLRFAERGLDGGGVPGSEIDEEGDHIVAAQVGTSACPRRRTPRRRAGTTTLVTPSSWASATACIAPPPPKRDQREVARVEPAVDGDQLERVDHVVVGDAHDAAGGFVGVHAQPRSHRLDGLRYRVHVGLHRAAAKIVAVDAAEPEIGVGRGRLGPAPARRRPGPAQPRRSAGPRAACRSRRPRRWSRRRCRSPPDRRPGP